MNGSFEEFARWVVNGHDRHDNHHESGSGQFWCEYSEEEQVARVVERLEGFSKYLPLNPIVSELNLFGFGKVRVYWTTCSPVECPESRCERENHDDYFLLGEAARELGWPLDEADDWARREYLDSIEAQRELDLESGRLGWQCAGTVVPLGTWLTFRRDPDDGKYRSFQDYLVSKDRLMTMISNSPWSREFCDNTFGLFAHFAAETGLMADLPSYRIDATGEAVSDDLTPTFGEVMKREAAQMSLDEAARRAIRGPALDDEQGA